MKARAPARPQASNLSSQASIQNASLPSSQPPLPLSEGSNIKVVARCRDRNEREIRAKCVPVVDMSGQSSGHVSVRIGPDLSQSRTYKLDRAYGGEADQSMVFDEVVAPIVSDFVAGMNCTVFAYGQTGTGKTYTMSGDVGTRPAQMPEQDGPEDVVVLSPEAGIIPRVLVRLFETLEDRGSDYCVSCSFVELYNEDLSDLLSDTPNKKLRIVEDPKRAGAVTIVGTSEHHITSATNGLRLLESAQSRRQVAETKMNVASSRSHTIFTLMVTTDCGVSTSSTSSSSNEQPVVRGKLNLVDLAGSENIGKSGAENKRAREAGMINQSLLTLGRVINALVDRSPHVPYRESKLTRLLQDSLGGHTKTCIIATISPASDNVEETLSTLEYASRAKDIKNKPQINGPLAKAPTLKQHAAEMERLQQDLAATRAKSGVYLDPRNYQDLLAERESQRILVSDQQRRLAALDHQLRTARDNLVEAHGKLVHTGKQLQSTTLDLGSTQQSLAEVRKGLETEKSARQALAAKEQKLRDTGHHLSQSLDAAIANVSTLQGQIAKRTSLEAAAANTIKAASGAALKALQFADSSIDTYAGLQTGFSNEVLRSLQRLVTDECVRLDDTANYISDSLVNLRVLDENMVSTVAQSQSDLKRLLHAGAEQIRTEVRAKVGEGLGSFKTSAQRLCGAVHEAVSSLVTQSPLVQELRQAIAAQTQVNTHQSQQLEALHAAYERACHECVAQLQHQASLQKQLDHYKGQAEDRKAALVASISRLVDDYARETDATLLQAAQDATGQDMANVGKAISSLLSSGNEDMAHFLSEKHIQDHQVVATYETTALHMEAQRHIHQQSVQSITSAMQRFQTETMQGAHNGGVDSENGEAGHSTIDSSHDATGELKSLDAFVAQAAHSSARHGGLVQDGAQSVRLSAERALSHLESRIQELRDGLHPWAEGQNFGNLADTQLAMWNQLERQLRTAVGDSRTEVQRMAVISFEQGSSSTEPRPVSGPKPESVQVPSRDSERQPLGQVDENLPRSADMLSSGDKPEKRRASRLFGEATRVRRRVA